MIATGTPRTSRSAFPFEIQQNTLASEGEIIQLKQKKKQQKKQNKNKNNNKKNLLLLSIG